MEIRDANPAELADADARVLEAAAAVLFRRYGDEPRAVIKELTRRVYVLRDYAKALRDAAGRQAPQDQAGL